MAQGTTGTPQSSRATEPIRRPGRVSQRQGRDHPRAEEESRAWWERLVPLLDGVSDGVLVQDEHGHVVVANAAARGLLGLPATLEELFSPFLALDETGQPIPADHLPSQLALLGVRVHETVLCLRDVASGQERWVAIRATPLLDEHERTRLVVTTFHDITERRRVEHALRFLDEASATLAASLADAPALARVATLAVPELADWCAIDLQASDGRTLRRVGEARSDQAWPEAREEPGGLLNPVSSPLFREALHAGRTLLYTAPSPDEPAPALSDITLAALVAHGVHAALVVPLLLHQRVFGVLTLLSRRPGRGYDSTDRVVVEEVAHRLALALDHARLYQTVVERERQLQELVGRLLLAHEEERRQIAYDVHDGLAQLAASTHQHLQAFATGHHPRATATRQELDQVLGLAQQTVREARRVVAHLRPPILDELGLAAALRLRAEELRAEGWRVTYQETLGNSRLPARIETVLFRVAQEALTNVRKHAQTQTVRIALRRAGQTIHLEIQDWGQGFMPTAVPPTATGERVGLSGIRERVALLGGHCRVESQPGAGTTVRIAVPVSTTTGQGVAHAGRGDRQ